MVCTLAVPPYGSGLRCPWVLYDVLEQTVADSVFAVRFDSEGSRCKLVDCVGSDLGKDVAEAPCEFDDEAVVSISGDLGSSFEHGLGVGSW